MVTYVLGAGASRHAGYPLAKSMGIELFEWMAGHTGSGCLDFAAAARSLKATFGDVCDVELLLTNVEKKIEDPSQDTLHVRDKLKYHDKPALVQAMREWFCEIRTRPAWAYARFANRIVQPGDCVITFNYDVSLDRELRLARLWQVGDGYWFRFDGLPVGSSVTILKLHGSANWLDEVSFQLDRPLIGTSELEFLDYPGLLDPRYPGRPIGAIPPLILPASCKRFYVDTNCGRFREDFWDRLWKHASCCIEKSERVVLCGYSMPDVDKRARELLFGGYRAHVEVCCGDDSGRIVDQLRQAGHAALVSGQAFFEDWVESNSA